MFLGNEEREHCFGVVRKVIEFFFCENSKHKINARRKKADKRVCVRVKVTVRANTSCESLDTVTAHQQTG